MILISIIIFLVSLPILFYLYFTWNFNYWKKRGVNGPEPKFLVGTFPSSYKGDRNIIYDFEDIYKKYKGKTKYVGVFTGREPQLLLLAPDIIHDVLVTKFRNFYDNHVGHLIQCNKKTEILALNPFFLKGQDWKSKRAEVTPALSANRIKSSYPVMEKVSSKLVDFIREQIQIHGNNYNFDAQEFCQRYTIQTVSDCVYGIDAGALNSENDSRLLLEARNLVNDFIAGFYKILLLSPIPFLLKLIPIKLMRESGKIFFTNLLRDAISLRKEKQNDRVDFLNYMIQLKDKKVLSDFEMLAHLMTFFADGFETSASTLANTLLCLGRNQDIQKELRDEIISNTGSDGSIPFERLHDLPLLNGCINEALRVLPILSYTSKICTEETTFTNYDGTTLKIEKGMPIHIPTYIVHNDEEYYPDPEKYDPERFSPENGGEKKYRDMGVFLPFGDGPRICLGQKFGLTQVKTGLCEVIRNFQVIPSEKTRKDNLIGSAGSLSTLKGGIWLQFREIKN
ncbi:probable cytochrome P450 28d1 [Condylostylus longicornis]|uniref:probable cytochrome P450 28d1 n=1 Tax=Condylostylus longicornis TaxID=2530218 RepID=UPI00244E35DE|nr:probable cytochrome P450 28d1 [Condylostylus longicornis]